MNSDIKKWLKKDGEVFLKGVGVKKAQTVLDFGCNEGHYTIPAAKVVENRNMVYAVDKDEKVLDKLAEIAKLKKLRNIKIVTPREKLKIPEINDCSVDIILLYDIIHLVSDRNKLYKEMYRILKSSGLLSIYPKHYMADDAGWGLKNMTLDNIIKELERANFSLENKFFKKLIHDDYFDTGYILNFRKK